MNAAPFTPAEITRAFERATQSMVGAPDRWRAAAYTGLTDPQLAGRLAYEIGIGGGCTMDDLWVEYQRNGLTIWLLRSLAERSRTKPILRGEATIRYARQCYGIGNPSEPQLTLL